MISHFVVIYFVFIHDANTEYDTSLPHLFSPFHTCPHFPCNKTTPQIPPWKMVDKPSDLPNIHPWSPQIRRRQTSDLLLLTTKITNKQIKNETQTTNSRFL